MNLYSRSCAFWILLVCSVCVSDGLSQEHKVDFEKQIRPILESKCFECHSTENKEGGLNLAVGKMALKGGESGAVLVKGSSKKSLLWRLVSGLDKERVMPPEGDRLSKSQIKLLEKWIDEGANWPESADIANANLQRAKKHWAFQPIKSVSVPQPNDQEWCKTDIDRFVLKRLEANGLSPSPTINANLLCRRIYFDLIGLPPTAFQLHAFEKEYVEGPDNAVAKLVDHLLSQQGYGERWARHWLDVARYADSNGQEADVDRPHAYRFRDFVIRSLNRDQSFDEFVRWQIAGDEIAPKNAEAIVATGFLTAGTCTILGDSFLEEERLRNRYNELDDIISTLGNSLLGLSLGCARCHDHKYDAVSSQDYYALMGIFQNGDRKNGKLPDGSDAYYFQDFSAERKPSYVFLRGDFQNKGKQIDFGFVSSLTRDSHSAEYWDSAKKSAPKGLDKNTTLQRKALAEWITDTRNGPGELVARVIVNRIWHHHFGTGLVKTNSDFGVRGDKPSHPELLEWLTADFIRHGWKLKRLHRTILLSAVYWQADSSDAIKHKLDPENRLLSRMRPRRMEAEILRDHLLAASGRLNRKSFGPGFKPFIPSEAILARNLKEGGYPRNIKESENTMRRSVYMFHKRVVPYPLFQAFDRPDLLQSCSQRIHTTVAPQALAILNDHFVRRRASDFAELLVADTDGSWEEMVDVCFVRSFSRSPSADEMNSSIAFLKDSFRNRKQKGMNEVEARKNALTDFCQAIFGLNEFVYVD